MVLVTAVYPNLPGSRFDAAYYRGVHADFARGLLGPHGLVALSLTIGECALDGTPPPFWAIGHMQFASRDAFDAAMAACGTALFDDAGNYTDVAPILQISRADSPPQQTEP